jgi:hypothetical protein
MSKMTDRIQHAWNAFNDKDQDSVLGSIDQTSGANWGNYHTGFNYPNDVILNARYTLISTYATMFSIQHVLTDANGGEARVHDGLDYCLNVEANLDESGKAFLYNHYYSLLTEGVIADVPVDTTQAPITQGGFDINTMRVGRIVKTSAQTVSIMCYDENDGVLKEIEMPKTMVGLVESPLYGILNSPNAALNIIKRKLKVLENDDANAINNRIDIALNVPYITKGQARKKQVDTRRDQIYSDLSDNRFGVLWLDPTEKITQLNRPIQSSTLDELQNATQDLDNQLGITPGIWDGTASEAQLLMFFARAIEPLVDFTISEWDRKFITKTARTQGHALRSYRDLFKFESLTSISKATDLFRRNEIMTANEVRPIVGLEPTSDARANVLANPNIADANTAANPVPSASSGSLTSPDGQ